MEFNSVSTLPAFASWTSNCFGMIMSFTKSTAFTSSRSKSTLLTMFMHRFCNPLSVRIATNHLVSWIKQNDFVKLVSWVLANPVRVQHSKWATSTSNTSLSNCLMTSRILQLINTMGFWLSISLTLGNLSFTASSSDTNAVNDVSLYSLVAKSSSLLRTRNTMNCSQFPLLPTASMTADCFLHHISRIYLYAPILNHHGQLDEDNQKAQYAASLPKYHFFNIAYVPTLLIACQKILQTFWSCWCKLRTGNKLKKWEIQEDKNLDVQTDNIMDKQWTIVLRRQKKKFDEQELAIFDELEAAKLTHKNDQRIKTGGKFRTKPAFVYQKIRNKLWSVLKNFHGHSLWKKHQKILLLLMFWRTSLEMYTCERECNVLK